MEEKSRDWVAIYYNKDGNEIGNELFKNRTSTEAFSEAETYMPFDCDDWTLTPLKLYQ